VISPWLALPAALAAAFVAVLGAVDMARTQPPRRSRMGGLRFRARVAVHHLLQPLVRFWGRNRHRNGASRDLGGHQRLPEGIRRVSGGIVVVPDDRPRSELAAALVSALRARGIRALPSSGWEDYDARLLLSPVAYGELQTSSHPEGFVQVRIRFRPRLRAVGIAGAAAVAALVITPVLALVPITLAAGFAQAAIRARRLPARVLPAEAK
jgi:hypothetical protein